MTAIAAEPLTRPTLRLVGDHDVESPVVTPAPVRVTGSCSDCAGFYITDLAWHRANAEQVEAWTVHGLGPHAGNGMCAACAAPGPDVAGDVVEQLTVDWSEKVAAHLAGRDVGLVKSRHIVDIRGEDDLDIWDVFTATYGAAPGAWQDDRACEGSSGLMLTEKRSELAQAKDLCGGCPVQAQCLTYALTQPDSASAGVWGGMHQRAMRDTREAIKREAYRRNGMKVGSFGKPVPLDA